MSGAWSLAAVALLVAAAVAAEPGDPARGRTIFALAGGCGCHTPAEGPVGAGGRPLRTPIGTFYGTNITPDRETGIGAWSDAQIVAAIRTGDRRGQGVTAPVMPYYQYAGMADRDVEDLVAYLRTLPAVRRENRPPDLALPLPRLAYRAWRFLFTWKRTPPAAAPAEPIARGRYLVDHVSLCGDCHTPRTRVGTLDETRYLAGSVQGPDGRGVPNITPDPSTGVGEWTAEDLTEVLATGMLPNFDNVQGLMAEMVEGYGGGPGYAAAADDDRRAIAAYLKRVSPIVHDVPDVEP